MPREVVMREHPRSRLTTYGLALLAPVITLLSVRWPLRSVLGDRVLYMPFFPAVLITAYVGVLKYMAEKPEEALQQDPGDQKAVPTGATA